MEYMDAARSVIIQDIPSESFYISEIKDTNTIRRTMEQLTPFIEPILVTRPLFPDLQSYTAKIQEIWDSKWLSNNGKQHIALEAQLKKLIEAKNLTLFNNGTIALMTALKAMDLHGEVITTPFSFPATSHAITWNNLKPVFADIDPDDFNIDPQSIEKNITKETSAILGVHVFGNPCQVLQIQKISEKYNLKVIYDAAHAFGCKVYEQPIANFGDITMFSFHPTKLFHTGEGGALSYTDSTLIDKINLLKNFGIRNEDDVCLPGLNGKMNELQAAMGLCVINRLEDEYSKRTKIFATYNEALCEVKGIRPIQSRVTHKHSMQYYAVEVLPEYGISRDQLHSELKKYNVFTRKYFFPLISNYPHYKDLASAAPNKLPVANSAVSRVLCLPFYGDLGSSHAAKIVDIIRHIRNN